MAGTLRRKKGAGKRLAPLDVDGPQDKDTGPCIRVKADLQRTVRDIQVAHARSLSSLGSGTAANEAARNAIIKDLLPETNEGPSFEVLQLEESVAVNARRFNDLKMTADRKHAELDKLLDQLNDMHLEKQEMDMHVAAQTSEARRIERLKNELQKVSADMKKKAFYKAQLEHMLRRLVKNERKYDRHISGMEDALKRSQKECKEVHHLLRQLQAGRASALQELANTKRELADAKAAQEQGMAERNAQVAAAKQVEEWRKHMDQQRAELSAATRNDLDVAGEQRLQQQLEQQELAQAAQKDFGKAQQQKVTTLEDAFNKIRHSTGVTTLDEMVDKFMGQGKKAVALEAQKVAAEARLKEAKARLEAQTQQLVDMKASGIGGTELNREEIDKIDEDILQLKAGLKVHAASCERLHAVLVAVRQGALGLQQRLAPFKGLVEQHEEIAMQSGSAGMGVGMSTTGAGGAGVACLDALRLVELKLGKMVEAAMQPGNASAFNEDGDGDGADGDVDPVVLNVGPHNLRVNSQKAKAKQESDEIGGADVDDDDDDEEDVPSHDKVKGIAWRKAELERRRAEAEAKKKRLEEMEDDEDGDARKASLRKRQKEQAAATKRLAEQHDKMDGLPIPGADPVETAAVFLTSVPDLV